MTDEQSTGLQEAANRAALEQEEEGEKPRRSLWGLVGIVILIVLVILVLLLLRDCGRGEGADEGVGKTIESVEGLDPMPGVVSVWVKPGADIEQVITAAGVDGSDALDVGDGRYVVQVPEGSEESAAKSIGELDNVYDAGRVYEKDAADDATP